MGDRVRFVNAFVGLQLIGNVLFRDGWPGTLPTPTGCVWVCLACAGSLGSLVGAGIATGAACGAAAGTAGALTPACIGGIIGTGAAAVLVVAGCGACRECVIKRPPKPPESPTCPSDCPCCGEQTCDCDPETRLGE